MSKDDIPRETDRGKYHYFCPSVKLCQRKLRKRRSRDSAHDTVAADPQATRPQSCLQMEVLEGERQISGYRRKPRANKISRHALAGCRLNTSPKRQRGVLSEKHGRNASSLTLL